MLEFRGRKRALTVPEVAERLGVHPETVGRWIRAKELPATKLGRGGKCWVAPGDLNRFLKARRTS